MTHSEAAKILDSQLLPVIMQRYDLEGYTAKLIQPHDGGRNVVYTCEKCDGGAKILRIAFLPDRAREDLLAEAEYIRYLAENGGSVSDVIESINGNLVEEVTCNNHTFSVSLFEKAVGKLLVENHYQYRDDVPIAEYFYNCGKVLGKMHQLSKGYTPVHSRYSFFDKYNEEYLNQLIPGSLSLLKEKMFCILKTLEGLDRDRESFGMVHFDYSDGNYMINFDTGDITVFDFDNSCFCWYMYDLANLWTHGVGWIQFERDAGKRKQFMEDYFKTVLDGYRSETVIEDSMLDMLPLFINVTLMESIVDAFEVMRNSGEDPECDEALSYSIKCMEDDIPYEGFFDGIYSCEEPFEYERRTI